MQEVLLDYGDGKMRVELPDSAMVVRYGKTYTDPPEVDPYEATRKALDKPLGFPPLRELGGPNKKVVIGFPDRVKGGAHAKCHRKVAIPMVIEELLKGGTKIENIKLLCATGLHRKNTLEEWYWYLGKETVDRFWPDRIVNHDAETDILNYGTDEMGNVVQCSRTMAEADLPIVIGHCSGQPLWGLQRRIQDDCDRIVRMAIDRFTPFAGHHAPQGLVGRLNIAPIRGDSSSRSVEAWKREWARSSLPSMP